MKTGNGKKILVICYGNPAREDDAIGPSIAEDLEKLNLSGITVDSDYQLTVEDAALVADHDVVIFVDAAVEGTEPFYFLPVQSRREENFSSHSVNPEMVVALARDLFHADTEAFKLGIRGYSFEMFTERMTGKARSNAQLAFEFLLRTLQAKSFDTTVH